MRVGVNSRWLVCSVLCLGFTGCGYPRADVSGVVTYNDKPISESPMGGKITFFGPDGKPVTTAIDAQGNYLAKSVCVGENKVAVSYPRPIAPPVNKRVPKTDQAPVAVDAGSPYLIPENYVTPETSELVITVERNTVYNPKLIGPEITK